MGKCSKKYYKRNAEYLTMKHILVTGGAGFIGSHVIEKLLDIGYSVTTVDNFDTFYSKKIKMNNLKLALLSSEFKLMELDITKYQDLLSLNGDFDAIIHLAAKAGVRPSIDDPLSYQITNVIGTQNLLEFARIRNIKQFVFASSSSVYGINEKAPWSEDDKVLLPISPYASSKVSSELLGHVYSHLFSFRFIALRFFTVYGPRQRPDLAIHKFTNLILNDKPIPFFGNGLTKRDYTFIDDIVDGVISSLIYNGSNFEIINLGNSQTITLNDLVHTIEHVFQKKAIINYLPEQSGDVPMTFADITKAKLLLDYHPKTNFEKGIELFKKWWYEEK